MITEGIFSIFLNAVYGLASAIPMALYELPNWALQTLKLCKIGLGIFPADVWTICIGNGVFWLAVQFVWAIIEWIYKKVPGVD